VKYIFEEILISDIKVDERFRVDYGDVEDLAQDTMSVEDDDRKYIWKNGDRWCEAHFEAGNHILKSQIVSSYEEYIEICRDTPVTSAYDSIAYVAYAALPGKRSVLSVVERRYR